MSAHDLHALIDQLADAIAGRVADCLAARIPTPAPKVKGPPPPEVMTTKQVAAYLGMSKQWLEGLRTKGGGPPFETYGRAIRYERAAVDAWRAPRGRKSTSEYSHAKRKR